MPLIRPQRYVKDIARTRLIHKVLTVMAFDTELIDEVNDNNAAFALVLSDN